MNLSRWKFTCLVIHSSVESLPVSLHQSMGFFFQQWQLQHDWPMASPEQIRRVVSWSHAEVIHCVKPFIQKNGSSSSSFSPSPSTPIGCVTGPTLWVSHGEGGGGWCVWWWQREGGVVVVQKEGQIQRVEISLSPGSENNTLLFTRKNDRSPFTSFI